MWQSVADYKAAAAQPTTTAQPPAEKPVPPPPDSPAPNAAVQRCCAAYKEARARSNDNEKPKDAFKNALPNLTDRASILDFIACITHGMVLNVFWNDEGPKLVAAAKAALAALPRQPHPAAENMANPGGRPKNKGPKNN